MCLGQEAMLECPTSIPSIQACGEHTHYRTVQQHYQMTWQPFQQISKWDIPRSKRKNNELEVWNPSPGSTFTKDNLALGKSSDVYKKVVSLSV